MENVTREPVEPVRIDERMEAGPWQRFWGRRLDNLVEVIPVGAVIGFICGMIAPDLMSAIFSSRFSEFLFGLLILPFVFLFDAAIHALFGNTLGKAIVGIRAERWGGGRLSFPLVLRRNMAVYVQGMWLGIPILVLVGMSNGYNAVDNQGHAAWDEALETRVYDNGGHIVRTVIAAILVILLTVGSYVIGMM